MTRIEPQKGVSTQKKQSNWRPPMRLPADMHQGPLFKFVPEGLDKVIENTPKKHQFIYNENNQIVEIFKNNGKYKPNTLMTFEYDDKGRQSKACFFIGEEQVSETIYEYNGNESKVFIDVDLDGTPDDIIVYTKDKDGNGPPAITFEKSEGFFKTLFEFPEL